MSISALVREAVDRELSRRESHAEAWARAPRRTPTGDGLRRYIGPVHGARREGRTSLPSRGDLSRSCRRSTLVERRLGKERARHLITHLTSPIEILVDFTSFEVMRIRDITTAFALDRHFADAGFELIP